MLDLLLHPFLMYPIQLTLQQGPSSPPTFVMHVTVRGKRPEINYEKVKFWFVNITVSHLYGLHWAIFKAREDKFYNPHILLVNMITEKAIWLDNQTGYTGFIILTCFWRSQWLIFFFLFFFFHDNSAHVHVYTYVLLKSYGILLGQPWPTCIIMIPALKISLFLELIISVHMYLDILGWDCIKLTILSSNFLKLRATK